ncbi:MAG: hypothetical protein EOP88_16535 [Verrucomicrobiaceae bacterium]|nr:MAG: hypothetical protein EOP88_16535 [Verrucomicrobiaceae bacterium]
MKAIHFIPPAVALVLVAVWNAGQMRSLGALEKDSAALRKELAAAGSSGVSGQDPVKGTLPGREKAGKGSVSGWKEMTMRLVSAKAAGEKSHLRATLDFQQRLSEMSADELISALQEISAMGLSDEDRESIEEMIMEALIKKDPQQALEQFADRIESDPEGLGWQLSSAMKEWAKKDLAAATAWFDRQIAAGKFESRTLDGRSETRSQFESALMESLMTTDPQSAGERLAALPEDQRREVLQQIPFSELSPEEQRAYTDLVRSLIPADERAGSFAHIAEELVGEDGYDKVGKFLDSVNATSSERSAAATQAAESRLSQIAGDGDISQGEVDSLRTWLGTQAPGEADAITGRALAEAAQEDGEFSFDEASELLQHYQRTSGNDEMLIAFLKRYSARSNLDEARPLIDLVSDPKIRDQFMKDLE